MFCFVFVCFNRGDLNISVLNCNSAPIWNRLESQQPQNK